MCDKQEVCDKQEGDITHHHATGEVGNTYGQVENVRRPATTNMGVGVAWKQPILKCLSIYALGVCLLVTQPTRLIHQCRSTMPLYGPLQSVLSSRCTQHL